MPSFESLSQRTEVRIEDFPAEWLPLTYLYDPDLPLFPNLYFHELDPELPEGQRPSFRDRVFGFVQYLNLDPNGSGATAGVVLNKNLSHTSNKKYEAVVRNAVTQRLGLGEPIKPENIRGCLTGDGLEVANKLLLEIWHLVVATAFGNKLPFGKNWDPVFGLIRYIASWNSDGGRKGELIQTHYFMSAFGERIHPGSEVNVDFYLLPTYTEFQDIANPLRQLYPKFRELVQASNSFVTDYCYKVEVGEHVFSAFDRKRAKVEGRLNTDAVLGLINQKTGTERRSLMENYNAFNRGPQRSVISLLMLNDLRKGLWDPEGLTPEVCAKMYRELKATYQTPKVIQLYAQQAFGSKPVLPIDNWVKTFLQWPLGFKLGKKGDHERLFASSEVWGMIERLIWVAAQARKVHSSVCAEILWCIRYGSRNKMMRGANPFSCKICDAQIRDVCPAYLSVKDRSVVFNAEEFGDEEFLVITSEKNNAASNQQFESVEGNGIEDDYSSRDRPEEFKSYPQPTQGDDELTVEEFIKIY